MSVWSNIATAQSLPLLGTEGVLVSVSISVAPPRLEALLDALAHLDFPINPQIHHDAGPATLVVFPAYEKRLPEIQSMLSTCGFSPDSVRATGMLDSIRASHAAAAF